MPWVHSPSVWQGRGIRLLTSITPGSFPSVCSHDFFSTPLLAHIELHTNAQTGDGIWMTCSAPSKEGFPTPESDTPLWDPSSCYLPVSISTCKHPPSHSPSNWTLANSRNLSTRQTSYPAKRGSAVPCESHTDATNLSFYRDVTGTAGRGWNLREVSPPTTRTSLPQALLPSSSPHWHLSFRGPQEGKWWNQQELEGFSPAGQQWERKKHILFHVWFASVRWRASLQRELAQSTPQLGVCHLRMGPRAEGKASASRVHAGCFTLIKFSPHYQCKALIQANPGFCERSVLNDRANIRHSLNLTCPWLHVFVTQRPQTCLVVCPPAT